MNAQLVIAIIQTILFVLTVIAGAWMLWPDIQEINDFNKQMRRDRRKLLKRRKK